MTEMEVLSDDETAEVVPDMFARNLKQLIYVDTFRLTKNVWCGEFRSVLLEKTPVKNTPVRWFASEIVVNGNRKPRILHMKRNDTVQRQVSTPPKISKSPIKWKTIVIVGTLSCIFLAFFRYLKNEKMKRIEAHRNREIGKAKLGGKFSLVDQDNKPVKSEDLYGDWLLIYFGFTHCPDICPEEIEKMVEVLDKIEKNSSIKKVKPIFITVDPERDTPAVIKKYLKEFSDKIIGLTGTVEQIAEVCKAYRVYFSPGPKDSDSDYIVDHSIIMYLVDPQGNFIDYYGQNKNAETIVNSIHFNQLKQNNLKKSTFSKISSFFSS